MKYYLEYVKLHWFKYALCILAIPILCYVFAKEHIHTSLYGMDIVSHVTVYSLYDETFALYGIFIPILYMIAGIPATTSFYDEHQAGSVNYQAIRIGPSVYLNNKSLLCFWSSLLTLFLGLSIYTWYLLLIVKNAGGALISEGQAIYLQNRPIMLLIIRNLLLSVNASMWNMIALVVSSFLGSHYLILTIPTALYFLFERMALFLTEYLNLYYLTLGYETETLTYPFNIIYAFVLFLFVSTCCGSIFIAQGRKCIERERIA